MRSGATTVARSASARPMTLPASATTWRQPGSPSLAAFTMARRSMGPWLRRTDSASASPETTVLRQPRAPQRQISPAGSTPDMAERPGPRRRKPECTTPREDQARLGGVRGVYVDGRAHAPEGAEPRLGQRPGIGLLHHEHGALDPGRQELVDVEFLPTGELERARPPPTPHARRQRQPDARHASHVGAHVVGEVGDEERRAVQCGVGAVVGGQRQAGGREDLEGRVGDDEVE